MDVLEGKGPRRRLYRWLEEVAKAVGGGYCRLHMPLGLALAVRETVAGHRLGALEGGMGVPPRLPMHPYVAPFGPSPQGSASEEGWGGACSTAFGAVHVLFGWQARLRGTSTGRGGGGGLWTEARGQQKQSNNLGNNQHNPQYANYWAPLTRKRHPPQPAQPRRTNDRAPRTRKRHQRPHRP